MPWPSVSALAICVLVCLLQAARASPSASRPGRARLCSCQAVGLPYAWHRPPWSYTAPGAACCALEHAEEEPSSPPPPPPPPPPPLRPPPKA